MKKSIFFILAALFLFINCLPSSIVFADDSGYTDSQLADIGTLMLTSLISSGEASELDFSEYTDESALDWLIAFGEMAVTGDVSGLVDQGLTWLGGELDDTYNSLIESIREWEHNVAPDLYNWWYNGSKYEYKLTPSSNISRPLSNILRNPNQIITPEPSPDFTFIGNINNLFTKDYASNTIVSFFDQTDWYNGGLQYPLSLTYNLRSCSYILGINGYSFHIQSPLPPVDLTLIASTPITIYVNVNSDNTVSVTYTNLNKIFARNFFNNTSYFNGGYYPFRYNYLSTLNGIDYYGCFCSDQYTDYDYVQNTFDGLSTAINYIYNHYANINLYVDGIPWALYSNDNVYPISIPGQLTVLNNLPVQYTFSEPTYIDLNGLKTLITNAINNSDVLTWQDIDDYFLDINGQQAFPVVQIYRNDYDNLYLEQYPYPAKLIGMQEPLTFNEHLLDNYYGQYLTPVVNVTSNTIDVLPGEIKWVLGIGAILMIFAVIINRLLE